MVFTYKMYLYINILERETDVTTILSNVENQNKIRKPKWVKITKAICQSRDFCH